MGRAEGRGRQPGTAGKRETPEGERDRTEKGGQSDRRNTIKHSQEYTPLIFTHIFAYGTFKIKHSGS